MVYGPVNIASEKVKEPVDWFISFTPMALCPEDGFPPRMKNTAIISDYKDQK
jgi:hypothetical protein